MSDFWVIIAKEQSVWNSDPDELTLLKLAPPWGSPSDTYLPKMKNKINVSNWKMFNLAFFDNLFFIWCFYAWKNSKENMLNCQITGTFPTQLVKIYFRGFSGPGGLSYYQTTLLWQVNLICMKSFQWTFLPLLCWAVQVRSKKRQVAKTLILWKEIEDLLGSRWNYNEERSHIYFISESIAITFNVDDNQRRNRRLGKCCTYGSIARSHNCHRKLATRR